MPENNWQTTPVYGIAQLRYPDEKIRFVLVADSHVRDADPDNEADLRSAIAYCRLMHPQGFFHVGDIGDSNVGQVRKSWYIIRECQTRIMAAIGNHDEEEYTLGSGNPNTEPLKAADMWNQNIPFVKSATLTAGDASWSALCIALDCNYYNDTRSENHEIGDRIGNGAGDPVGGYNRQLGAAQNAQVAAILAANPSTDAIFIFTHYHSQVQVADYDDLIDMLAADGRPAIGFCGHDHADAEVLTWTGTGENALTVYKLPALLESGCWIYGVFNFADGAIVIDSLEIQNYTDPGGWTINLPFTLAA